ncbi:MAG: hypothetical protein DMG31_03755 [Acidobacteria bacterium]|nr:MAG: hypothetical protein DMG31_03755 [Acidobacteriota bacterium]
MIKSWLVHWPGVGKHTDGLSDIRLSRERRPVEISGFHAHDNEAISLWTFLSPSISICIFRPIGRHHSETC